MLLLCLYKDFVNLLLLLCRLLLLKVIPDYQLSIGTRIKSEIAVHIFVYQNIRKAGGRCRDLGDDPGFESRQVSLLVFESLLLLAVELSLEFIIASDMLRKQSDHQSNKQNRECQLGNQLLGLFPYEIKIVS